MTVKDILDLGTDSVDIYDVNNTNRMMTIDRIAYKKGMVLEKLLNSEVADISAFPIGVLRVKIHWTKEE
jgi:hypothetical protein